VEKRSWDLYADPDDYQKQSPSALVDAWEKAGVRRVYISAWKQNDLARTRYDYKKLVDLLHGRGIQAYAWLAWPYVDTSMLTKYPDCQERTASGTLAQLGGQGYVALAVPECFERAWTQSAKVLNSAAFDGTNIVNLTFASPYSGPKSPEVYTPFHPLVRSAFISEHGFDPVSLVRNGDGNWKKNPQGLATWEAYRAQALTDIYEKLLTRLQANWPQRSVAITAMDDRNDPSIGELLRKNSGRSTDALMSLQQKHPFELMIGDDLEFRKDDPSDIMKHYVSSGSKPPTMLLSLAERATTDHPITPRIGGLELYSKLGELSAGGSTVAINPQGPLAQIDLDWIKHALSPGVELRAEGDQVFTTTNAPFRLLFPGTPKGLSLDGKPVKRADFIEIPAGEHQIAVQR
jgi:hypothetical protein